VLEAVFILLEFLSPSRRIFIGSHSLPPSLVSRIGPSQGHDDHALRSMAGPHRGKGESFLTSVAKGQSESVDEEGVDAVKSGLEQWKMRKQCVKACVAMTGPAPPHGRLRT
jgi:hypothetical protein